MASRNGNGSKVSSRVELPDPMVEKMIDRAVERIVQNQATHNDARSLPWLGSSGRLLDPRRDLNLECGYPETYSLMPDDYRNLYDRNPIASRVVDCLPRECWKVTPHVHEAEEGEDDTNFDEAWKNVVTNVFPGSKFKDEQGSRVWEYLQRLDVLSGIGSFGVLLMGFDDHKRMEDPVDGVVAVPTKNVDEGRSYISPPQDCFMTEAEEKEMLTPTPRRHFTGNYDKQGDPIYDEWKPAPLNELEKLVVNKWHQEREAAKKALMEFTEHTNPNQRVSDLVTANANPEGHNQYTEGGPHPVVAKYDKLVSKGRLTKEKAAEELSRYGASLAIGRGFGETATEHEAKHPEHVQFYTDYEVWRRKHGFTANDAWGDPGKDSDLGTDAQYASSPTMTNPSGGKVGSQDSPGLSGTDQQYYGVQFGPTQQPATKQKKLGTKLIFLRPFDESLVQVVRYEWNVYNPRFGQPVMYRITLNDPREMHSGVGLPMASVFVHWSRVIHVPSCGNSTRMSSDIFGTPRMRPVLNRLLDLDKIHGGGAEGYWQSCFPILSVETHPQLGGDVTVDEEAFQDMMQKIKNKLQRSMLLRGMSAKSLPPSVLDPTPHVEVAITSICIKMGVPKRVFMGSERGELASSQDDSDHNERVAGRQHLHCNPAIVVAFIDRLIQVGVLPEPKNGFHSDWPSLDTVTDLQKAQVGAAKVGALRTYVGPQGDVGTVLTEQRMYLMLGETKEDAEAICAEAAERQEDREQEQYEHQQKMAAQGLDAQGNPLPEAKQGTEEPSEEETTAQE